MPASEVRYVLFVAFEGLKAEKFKKKPWLTDVQMFRAFVLQLRAEAERLNSNKELIAYLKQFKFFVKDDHTGDGYLYSIGSQNFLWRDDLDGWLQKQRELLNKKAA